MTWSISYQYNRFLLFGYHLDYLKHTFYCLQLFDFCSSYLKPEIPRTICCYDVLSENFVFLIIDLSHNLTIIWIIENQLSDALLFDVYLDYFYHSFFDRYYFSHYSTLLFETTLLTFVWPLFIQISIFDTLL